MPTTTPIFDMTLTNWGPLPTTSFAVPAACSTISTVEIFATDLPDLVWQECNQPTTPLCHEPAPTDPTAVEDLYATDSVVGEYYSPAPACPDGHKTVGVASRGVDGTITREGFLVAPTATPVPIEVPGSLIPSGVAVPSSFGLAPPAVTPTPTSTPGLGAGLDLPADFDLSDLPVFFGLNDALIALLEPSETAVWCCPQSMTAGSNGYCSSTLPTYPFSSACQTIFGEDDIATYTTGIPGDDGHTTEGALAIVTATTTGSVLTTTFPAEETTGFVAVSVVPALTLVHKPTDLPAGSGSGSGSGEEDAVFTGAAAKIVAGGGRPWGSVVGVFGVLLASLVAGGMVVLV
ncbi:hypothetical protein BJY00DRAFT_312157 [Aspergillus carlsbadensis]|nr:hypothetical protein BJY00DRAFT_312157 [Aspergillus carlsbadensis]